MTAKYLSLVAILAICSNVASAQYGGGGGMGGTGKSGTPSSTRSYGSKVPVVVGAVGGAAAAGLLYWRLHKRSTVIGCVGEDGKTLLSEMNNQTYKLKKNSVDLKPSERVEVAGKLSGKGADLSLDVRQLRKDFGSCKTEVGLVR